MARLLTLVSLLFTAAIKPILAAPCIAFDANFNLLVFGLGGKDYNAGTQSSWGSDSPSAISASGRPPFDGPNPTCYLAQFFNAVYVFGADTANPSSVYIFDAITSTWSMQATTPGSFDFTSYDAILDHDTNVFYALSNGELFFLDMGELVTANSSAIAWTDVEKAQIDTTNYQPVMALAQNHVHFLNVPGVPAGSADIYVIHFNYFQPEAQAYPLAGGGTFPATHGQATSFFQPSDVQQEFAFIPDDGSATYVINVETNTTQQLAGPAIKDSRATYFAGITSLVQLSSSGVVSYLPYTQNDTSTNSAAQWTTISALASLAPSPNSTSTGKAGGTATASGSSSSSTGSSSKGSGAASNRIVAGLSTLLAIAGVAVLLS